MQKVVYTPYNSGFDGSMDQNLVKKLEFDGFDSADIDLLKDPNVNNLHKIGVNFADGVTFGSSDVDKDVIDHANNSGKMVLEYQNEETAVRAYSDFYDQVTESNSVLVD